MRRQLKKPRYGGRSMQNIRGSSWRIRTRLVPHIAGPTRIEALQRAYVSTPNAQAPQRGPNPLSCPHSRTTLSDPGTSLGGLIPAARVT